MDDDSCRFSSGLELGNSIVASDLLQHSWKAIMKVRSGTTASGSSCLPLFGHYDERPNSKIIAFVMSPNSSDDPLQGEGGDLVSISSLRNTFPVFEFLCSKHCSDFSINTAAVSLFQHFHDVYEREISMLGCNSNTQLIITGHALGGAIASLFTLMLLDSLDLSKTKRPLCITFGSPLVGNEALHNAILQFSTWSSCFLHVVSNSDPMPRLFLNRSSHRGGRGLNSCCYYPFGTFLLCSELGCSCYEDPKSILELLNATANQGHNPSPPQPFDYEEMIDRLVNQAYFKATTNSVSESTKSLQGSFIAQLEALGVAKRPVQRQQNVDISRLIGILTEGEVNLAREKTTVFDPSTILNEIKINMAKFEWYKKTCKSQNIGYYDSYKKVRTETDIRVAEFKRILTDYWKKMVEEVERKPQKEGASFRTRWLFGGTNYRRMVEPLDIAEHYRRELKDYQSQRPRHYKKLEEWLAKPTSKPTQAKKETVASILTEDSCFWAHVEEALLACEVVKMEECDEEEREAAMAKLRVFEDYVVGMLKNYDVSPEIFLEHSSFMRWWREYDEIMGDGHDSVLTRLMRNEQYEEYADGRLEIH